MAPPRSFGHESTAGLPALTVPWVERQEEHLVGSSGSRSRRRRGSLVGRRVGPLLVAVSLSVAGALAMAPPASAATCHSTGCNGLSPYATGCYLDGRVVDTNTLQRRDRTARSEAESGIGPVLGHVQLWESPSCGTVWTTASQLPGQGKTLTTFIYASSTWPNYVATRQTTTADSTASLMASPTSPPVAPYLRAHAAGFAGLSEVGEEFDERKDAHGGVRVWR
jgi:hypothetical protein